ncbi:hypothetical protein NIIDNTM18_23390 [Mycolicibacterium litorale]|uniref:Uncharacterized protein n=1 Tax=Mycolicibacterium litorale TaxID=758802 RepID=A0A6S6P616_9MYCO|nr:hypothetical protein [Mycolicibacterium litorale]BCI53061.1 hypothetical protein NIIDNTM18_23390 [Mycolicibacterium litorale]
MTALQDWLSIPTAAPRAVGSFVWRPLRSVLPGRSEEQEDRRLLRPGLERC